MRIEEATRTKYGHPVIIYRTDMGGKCPIHGAVYEKGEWFIAQWTEDGKVNNLSPPAFDLDLTDWRDEIPWDNLHPEIKVIVRDERVVNWVGVTKIPQMFSNGWALRGTKKEWFQLEGLYIPKAPDDWSQTLAIRPGYEKYVEK